MPPSSSEHWTCAAPSSPPHSGTGNNAPGKEGNWLGIWWLVSQLDIYLLYLYIDIDIRIGMINASWKSTTENSIYKWPFWIEGEVLIRAVWTKGTLDPSFPFLHHPTYLHPQSPIENLFFFFFTTVLNKGESRRLHKQGLCLECNQDSGQQRKTDSRGELRCHCSGGIT